MDNNKLAGLIAKEQENIDKLKRKGQTLTRKSERAKPSCRNMK